MATTDWSKSRSMRCDPRGATVTGLDCSCPAVAEAELFAKELNIHDASFVFRPLEIQGNIYPHPHVLSLEGKISRGLASG